MKSGQTTQQASHMYGMVRGGSSSLVKLKIFVTQDEFEADQKRQDDDIEAGFDTQGSILMKNIEQDQTLGVHSGQINALETQVQLLGWCQSCRSLDLPSSG